jgi:glycosyltransferase involved in cell wall biosynthesis
MKVLFLHPNFPAQFRHVAQALGRDPAHRVVFATKNERPEWNIPGVRKALYRPAGEASPDGHRLVSPFETAVREGEGVFALCRELRSQGFVPDLVYVHAGWGTGMYVKDAFPESRIMGYFEWFYDPLGVDANFDPPPPGKRPQLHWEKAPAVLRTRNMPLFNDLWVSDQGLSPTYWQRSQLPVEFRHKVAVLHDGVDCGYFAPAPGARLVLPELDLSGVEELVTYATRGMEPYRGFPQFMEAAALLLRERPRVHVAIAGSERVCYGTPLPEGKTFKQLMLERLDLPLDRVHFVGSLPYGQYRQLLLASSVHVYLTRPFVLSWSAVEAMACGCCLVASDTEPVREALVDGESALLCKFHDPADIARRIGEALDDKAQSARCREGARRTALERYDLARLLPLHLRLMANTAAGKGPVRLAGDPSLPPPAAPDVAGGA